MNDRRVLHLAPRAKMEARREGPALAVHSGERAPLYYPVRRLARVISSPRVTWQGDAIRLLIEHAVPLLFVEPEGRVVGLCLGGLDDVLGLQAHLDTAIARPNWPQPYRDWRRAQERRLLLHLYAAFDWPTDDLRPASAYQRLAAALCHALGDDWRRRLAPAHAQLRGQVIEGLVAAGLDPVLIAGQRGQVPLGRDFATLLGWTLRGRILAEPSLAATGRAFAAYYERVLEPRLASSLRYLIAALWRLRAY